MTDKKITELDAFTTPIDADVIPIVNTTASTTKKISWVYIKSFLKTYFDTLYSAANGAITGATKTKITYDAKGLVTAGVDATTADIADSADARYCTDAQKTVIGNTSGTNSGNETTTTAGALINGATAKTSAVDADYLGLMDSEATNVLKKLSWAYVKSILKTYFDTLYCGLNAWTTFTPTVTLVGGSGNTVPVYSTNLARYLQIGKTVFVNITLSGDGGDEGAGTGVFNVALPVAAGISALNGYIVCGRYRNNTVYSLLLGQITASATNIALYKQTTGTAQSEMTGADQSSTGRLIDLSFWYEVA